MDGIHGHTLTITTKVVDGEPDEFGQPQYAARKTVLEGCNVQPVAVTGLLTGDSRIEWNGRIFQPASAAFDYVTPDGIGNHTEWWMTEVTS